MIDEVVNGSWKQQKSELYAQPIRGMGRGATGPVRFFTFMYHLLNICWGLFLWARTLESSSRGASLLKRSPRLLGWGSWKRGAVIIQWEWWRRGKRLVKRDEVVPVWNAKSMGERDSYKDIAWWVSERKSMWIRSEAPTSAYRHKPSVENARSIWDAPGIWEGWDGSASQENARGSPLGEDDAPLR